MYVHAYITCKCVCTYMHVRACYIHSYTIGAAHTAYPTFLGFTCIALSKHLHLYAHACMLATCVRAHMNTHICGSCVFLLLLSVLQTACPIAIVGFSLNARVLRVCLVQAGGRGPKHHDFISPISLHRSNFVHAFRNSCLLPAPVWTCDLLERRATAAWGWA